MSSQFDPPNVVRLVMQKVMGNRKGCIKVIDDPVFIRFFLRQMENNFKGLNLQDTDFISTQRPWLQKRLSENDYFVLFLFFHGETAPAAYTVLPGLVVKGNNIEDLASINYNFFDLLQYAFGLCPLGEIDWDYVSPFDPRKEPWITPLGEIAMVPDK